MFADRRVWLHVTLTIKKILDQQLNNLIVLSVNRHDAGLVIEEPSRILNLSCMPQLYNDAK